MPEHGTPEYSQYTLKERTVFQTLIRLRQNYLSVENNTMMDWHAYQDLMEQHGTPGDGSATALMLGGMSVWSTRSFVACAKELYGADKAITIDLVDDPYKKRHGTFLRADALRLPFADGSMNFVHTNLLLPCLVGNISETDPWSNPTDYAMPGDSLYQRLFSEIWRVLAPNGQLCMIEAPGRLASPPPATDEGRIEGAAVFGRVLEGLLDHPDTAHIATHHIKYPFKDSMIRTAQDMAYLFDSTRTFNFEDGWFKGRTISLYARKEDAPLGSSGRP